MNPLLFVQLAFYLDIKDLKNKGLTQNEIFGYIDFYIDDVYETGLEDFISNK